VRTSTAYCHLDIKLNAPNRHLTCSIVSFSHDRIRNWSFWIWRTHGSLVIVSGHLQRANLAYLLELPRVEKGAVLPNLCYALLVQPVLG
jgi:hypothetical protein